MIDWQTAGVVVIVAAAVWYLSRKFFGRPRPKSTTTFVPLASLKKPDGAGGSGEAGRAGGAGKSTASPLP
jgi:hypothetical protein